MNTSRGHGGNFLFNAAIFAFLAFYPGWVIQLPFMAVFVWTLRIGAVLFAVAAILAFWFDHVTIGGVVSVLAGLGLIIAGAMDFMDKSAWAFPYSVPVLLFFGIYDVVGGIRLLGSRRPPITRSD